MSNVIDLGLPKFERVVFDTIHEFGTVDGIAVSLVRETGHGNAPLGSIHIALVNEHLLEAVSTVPPSDAAEPIARAIGAAVFRALEVAQAYGGDDD